MTNKITKKLFLVSLLCFAFSTLLMGGTRVYAAPVAVDNADALRALFGYGGEIILMDDITIAANTAVRADTDLDLNGHTLSFSDKTLIPYAHLTVRDTSEEQNGKITSTAQFTIQNGGSGDNYGYLTLESGLIDCQGLYCIHNYNGTIEINGGEIRGMAFVIYNTSKDLIMNGGTVTATNGNGVQLQQNATFTMNGGLVKTESNSVAVNISKPGAKMIMNDGTLEAFYANPDTGNGGNAISIYKDGELIVNGGVIHSTSPAILGNGSNSGSSDGSNAKITINGGLVESNRGPAMYIPQVNGNTTVNGGVISGQTGIEIRAGKLTVTGGEIRGSTDEYSVISNPNGSTTIGAAIAVMQHVTLQPIEVNILGGTMISYTPVSFENPEDNPDEDLEKVEIYISGGSYEGENYDDVVEHIVDGYVDIDVSNGIAVVPEGEADDESDDGDEAADGDSNKENSEGPTEEGIVKIPDTGRNTNDPHAGANFDAVTQIFSLSVVMAVVTIGVYVAYRHHQD